MGACCGRPSGAACSQLAAPAGLLLSAADWALLRGGRGVTGSAAVLALGDEGLGCAHALQLRSDPSCFFSASWGLPSADVRFARPVICKGEGLRRNISAQCTNHCGIVGTPAWLSADGCVCSGGA